MANYIQLGDKDFKMRLSPSEVEDNVKQLADRINIGFQKKNPLFLVVLNGSFRFAADLISRFYGSCGVEFIKIQSYKGSIPGEVKQIIGLDGIIIKDRHIIILEDLIDTGNTLTDILNKLYLHGNPASIRVCSFLFKPNSYKGKTPIDYYGISISDNFVVGYGMDYNGEGRNLNAIYQEVK